MSFPAAPAAARLLADLRLRQPGSQVLPDLPEDLRPPDLMAAYDVQAELRQLLATRGLGPQIGWKIGCTTPVMQDYLKIPHPCAGTLYRESVAEGQASLHAADYFQLGLECEIAVRLTADLPLQPTPFRDGEMRAAVGEVMASIEIVEHRFRNFRQTDTASLVADDFFSAGCVLGAPVPVGEIPDLNALRGGFSINGQRPAETGTGAEIMGNPLGALAWLADHAARLGTPLAAGQIVTLGSVVKTVYPRLGQRIETRFTRLPPAIVEVI